MELKSFFNQALSPRGLSEAGRPDLFEEFFRAPFGAFGRGLHPSLDVTETAEEILVKAELPGVEPKEVELTIDGDVLTLKGEKRYEKTDEKSHVRERGFGSFQRSVSLPGPVAPDEAKAEFVNGVLVVRLKKSAEALARRIPVEG